MDAIDMAITRALKHNKGAKATAVKNFVWSAPDDKEANRGNLELDAGMYRWNPATRGAIYEALKDLNKI
jgi:hypothetical protein